MLYLVIGLGLLTTVSIFAIIKRRKRKRIQLNKILFRQSVIYNTIKPALPTNQELREKKERQSKNHDKKSTIKVVISPDNKCYWVVNNTFYCADMVDGYVDPETTRAIETHDLPKQEINRLLEILDTLRNE